MTHLFLMTHVSPILKITRTSYYLSLAVYRDTIHLPIHLPVWVKCQVSAGNDLGIRFTKRP